MNRVEILRKHIDEILLGMTDVEERRAAYVHLYGVSQTCALIAQKRGEDIELAIMAGMLHDIYSYTKMDASDHAHKGAVKAKEILASLQITSGEETEIIYGAIYTHGEKDTVHSGFNEVLKDADVFQHYLYNPAFEIQSTEMKARCESIKHEFGIA